MGLHKMTITKDLKPEFAFMTMIDKLIKDYGQKEHFIAYHGHRLFFKCEGYAAMMRTKATHNIFEDFLGIEEGKYRRKILDAPYGSFELSKTDRFSDEMAEEVVKEINSILDGRLEFCMESDKEMLYKLSVITESTGNWLKDSDLKLFNTWTTFKVFRIGNTTIIARNELVDEGQEYFTFLIINPKGTGKESKFHQQQSMNLEAIENDSLKYIGDAPEESEEEQHMREAKEALERSKNNTAVEVIENDGPILEGQETIEAEELQEAVTDIENQIDEIDDFIMPGM